MTNTEEEKVNEAEQKASRVNWRKMYDQRSEEVIEQADHIKHLRQLIEAQKQKIEEQRRISMKDLEVNKDLSEKLRIARNTNSRLFKQADRFRAVIGDMSRCIERLVGEDQQDD